MVTGNDIGIGHGVLPPGIAGKAAAIPHHERTPLGSSTPDVGNVGKAGVTVKATLAQDNHLAAIGSLNFVKLLLVLRGVVAVQVAGNHIHILVAGIPVGVLVVGRAVAVVILRGPYPPVSPRFLRAVRRQARS